jgi:hypothetical protein
LGASIPTDATKEAEIGTTKGFPGSYGVLLEHYLHGPLGTTPGAQTLIPLVGTLNSGIMFLAGMSSAIATEVLLADRFDDSAAHHRLDESLSKHPFHSDVDWRYYRRLMPHHRELRNPDMASRTWRGSGLWNRRRLCVLSDSQ